MIIPFFGVGGKYGAFSNWYIHPDSKDDLYNCVEKYMMIEKAHVFNDTHILNKLLHTDDPREIKRLGRLIKNYDDGVWSRVRYGYVFQGCLSKFILHNDLRDLLLGTGDATLVEASPYDKIWGIGMAADDPRLEDRSLWGQNLLGQVLMDVRTCLKNCSFSS